MYAPAVRACYKVMARDHNLANSEQQVAILRLYVHRAVFPLIADSCFWFASEDSDTGKKTVPFALLLYVYASFCQDRLGTNTGEAALKKSDHAFSCRRGVYSLQGHCLPQAAPGENRRRKRKKKEEEEKNALPLFKTSLLKTINLMNTTTTTRSFAKTGSGLTHAQRSKRTLKKRPAVSSLLFSFLFSQLLLPKDQVGVGIDPKFCRPPKETGKK